MGNPSCRFHLFDAISRSFRRPLFHASTGSSGFRLHQNGPDVVGIVMRDVALGCRDALVERIENRVPVPLPRELGEETLDGIRSRGCARSEVDLPVGTVLRPFMSLGQLVRGQVVEDHVCRGFRLDPPGDTNVTGHSLMGSHS